MDNSIPKLLGVLAIVATSAGCMVHARASATASGEADAPVTYASRPTLVAVGSGVWVVRGSAHATYYVSDSYWCYREGVWYRSSSYSGGWATVQVSVVPTVIVNGNHSAYVNYQGSATAQTMPAPGSDVVASNDKSDNNGPGKKDKDELPGVGNKRKAAGDQPGTVGKGLTKDKDPEPPKASPPSAEASPKAEKKAEKAEAKAEKAEAKAEKKDDNAGKKK